ncbi:MAG TPA: RNA polymerase subunit sigma-24, partial [Bacteroidetes bacterium]|nr:RNA polymerase subunit sigma-24 [Bacteroidota bacterium]
PQNLEETIDLQNAVREAIRQLPEKLRSVVILREIEGFSEAETTKILKIPSGTVKSRLFHARKKLKKILEKSL